MYHITLGHSPKMSLLELSARKVEVSIISDQLVSTDNSDILTIAPELAGITRLIKEVQVTSPDSLISDLTSLVRDSGLKNHAITNYSEHPISEHHLYSLRSTVKETRPVRFLSFETSDHSLIAIRKQHVAEFSVIEHNSTLVIGKTVWIQDADDWTQRDRSRPYQDIKRGMLPPKIARLMVNLATGGENGVLLDPFCGTGTILMEAMLLGNQVVGSDNDSSAIAGTKRNISWLQSEYSLPTENCNLHTVDATHIDQHISNIDFIATEPYLGPLISHKLIPTHQKLFNTARGLDKLYRGALRSWSKMLKEGGRVVIVIPEFHAYGTVIPTLKIDTIDSLGYNYVDSVAYSKPGAIVVRNITILEKKN